MAPWFTFVDYDSGRDGQIAVGTTTLVNSSGTTWFDATGISHIVMRGVFAGGTTTITVEQSREGSAAIVTDSGITAASVAAVGGVSVAIAYQFVRIKVVQTTSPTTNAQLAVKGLAS